MLHSTDTQSDSVGHGPPSYRQSSNHTNYWVWITVALLVAAAGSFVCTYIQLRQIPLSAATAFCVFASGLLAAQWVVRNRRIARLEQPRTRWAMNSVYNRELAQFKRMGNRVAMFAMSPIEFECYVLRYFEYRGFDTTSTPPTGDGGIDGIISRNGYVAMLQCKRQRKAIAQAPVREFLGVLTKMNADAGYFVTSGTFGPGARRFANGTIVSLVDGEKLIQLIRKIPFLDPVTELPFR